MRAYLLLCIPRLLAAKSWHRTTCVPGVMQCLPADMLRSLDAKPCYAVLVCCCSLCLSAMPCLSAAAHCAYLQCRACLLLLTVLICYAVLVFCNAHQSLLCCALPCLSVDMSSICMWAYAGEICFSPSASKIFPRIIPHTVPKGRGHGFNDSIYL